MNSDSLYAFYGSLRKGMSNHAQFQDSLAFQFKESIPGFQLYQMEEYPYAVHTGLDTDVIMVEVYKITEPGVERAIHELETEVGYYYDEVLIQGKRVGIYLYKNAGSEPLVKSGDWVEFFGSR